MGKLVDKVNLKMTFKEVYDIVGKPHKVIVVTYNGQKIIWQYFNSRGQLEIVFNEGHVNSKTIYKKGEVLPDHRNHSRYGKTGSWEILTGGFSLNLSKDRLDKIRKQFDTWN